MENIQKKTIAILMLLCVTAFAQQKGLFTDPRDDKMYKTVKIGTQTWMAENLNYNASGSVCYDSDPFICKICGRLYDWKTAMKACPKGWHLPSAVEWNILVNYVGGEYTAGTELKSREGWGENGNGTDAYGFAALPGGQGGEFGGSFGFRDVGGFGFWWSSNKAEFGGAYFQGMRYHHDDTYLEDRDQSNFYSVRCLHD